jgi:phage RecT family recombinase
MLLPGAPIQTTKRKVFNMATATTPSKPDQKSDKPDAAKTEVTATVNAAKHPLAQFRDRLEARREMLKQVCPPDVSVDALIRATLAAATLNPDLLVLNQSSLLNALLKCARDGLLPDGVEAAIVPFKQQASYIPMYQGLLRRFRRSGQFKWIKADLVRKGEEFTHYVDENGEHFRHTPGADFDAPVEKVYALATTKDGGIFITVMTIQEVNKIKAMSKASRDDAPWKLWESEMQKKTALRRLCKLLPNARDLIAPDEITEPETAERIAAAIGEPLVPFDDDSKKPDDVPAASLPTGVAATLDQIASNAR